MTLAVNIAQGGSNNVTMRNRIINGAMVIDQRNAGAAVTVSTSVNTFPVDRMVLLTSGATATAQRVAGTGAYTYDVLYTGAASVTASYFFQRIESVNCLDLVNKTVTFQVQLSSTTVTSVAVGLFSAGSTDNFSAPVSISTTTFTITSTPTIYTWTVGAGANAANGLQIQLNFGAFTSGTARVSGLQLEAGTTASPFEYRQYGTELALCQRYYWQAINGNNQELTVGWYWSTTQISLVMNMPVPMRTGPSISQVTGTNYYAIYSAGITDSFDSLTVENAGKTMVSLLNSTQVSGTAGYAGIVRATNASSYLGFTAEL